MPRETLTPEEAAAVLAWTHGSPYPQKPAEYRLIRSALKKLHTLAETPTAPFVPGDPA